ncbi:glycosyltransferase family 4 protein [Halococcus sp. IIIV-5B]|uniref:glycosyltransferase family 4 protein n=1 Tax=Halococcus sp. IIIV-5B TaxID=2321230 RepID=UPI000E7334AD|nr:glycosyltransferase family 4 protein [Halococcus sp. IIIV-5B]RJT07985.1 glycosyltransferase family 1 protein [Halococcus sp. IIIV-5B]
MTHVLLFAPLYPPYSGGSPTYFSNLVDSLSSEHTFSIVTAYHSDEPIVEGSDGYVIYRVIPFYQSLPAPVRLLLESLTAFVVSLYLMLSRSIGVAHIHATSYASPAIAVAASATDTPVIYDCRDLSFPPWIVNIGTQPLVFSCAPNVDNILGQEGVPEDRIVRVPITNPEYVSEYADNDAKTSSDGSSSFTIVYVGNLREFKGVGILIKAVEDLIQEIDGIQLRVIGNGPHRSTLQEYVDEAGLGEHIDFAGERDHREALQCISRSDVLVHPSDRETGPRSVTEAIELGTTVVATPVGIVPEIVEEGANGVIAERSVDGIKESLMTVYAGRERSGFLTGERSGERVYDWETVEKTVSESYYSHSDR